MSSKKPAVERTVCPKCNKYEHVGFLGGSSTKKYFCSDCCIEFNVTVKRNNEHELGIYDITPAGTVVRIHM